MNISRSIMMIMEKLDNLTQKISLLEESIAKLCQERRCNCTTSEETKQSKSPHKIKLSDLKINNLTKK